MPAEKGSLKMAASSSGDLSEDHLPKYGWRVHLDNVFSHKPQPCYIPRWSQIPRLIGLGWRYYIYAKIYFCFPGIGHLKNRHNFFCVCWCHCPLVWYQVHEVRYKRKKKRQSSFYRPTRHKSLSSSLRWVLISAVDFSF